MYAGSTDYWGEVSYYVVNTVVKSRTDKEQYYIGSDDYGLHTMTTIIAPGLTASGRDICRRPEFPPDFSILIKFAMSDSDPAIFNFLNVTNQLAITLDRCNGADDSLVISFPGCQQNTLKFPLKVVSNKFHKIGIRFTQSNVAVYFDCEFVASIAKTKCSLLCDESVDVHILQPQASTSCRFNPEEVRRSIPPKGYSPLYR